MNSQSYTAIQTDALKELANIGGGNAATAIAHLVSRIIHMNVPRIDILDYAEVFSGIMAEDEDVVAVNLQMLGDGQGSFLFVTSPEHARVLTKLMLPKGMPLVDELEDSALCELVNIIVSSYLHAVSRLTDLLLISSVPALTRDMFGAVLSSTYLESGQYDDQIMIIRNEFLYEGTRVDSALYFIPRPGVLEGLFNKLGL